jgi:hypothetical protein
MSKRTTFTSISPLPAGISRELVLSTLHNHAEMIDLNPLVIERHPIPSPPNAEPDEVEAGCAWWSMTDEISYMPGVKGDLTYTAAFQDLKDGMRTHCYAPMGTHIRGRWTLSGTLPGEPAEPVELGLVGVPAQGLYLREDVDIRCNFLMAGFVKKTILKSHGVLVDRLVSKAADGGDVAANTSISSPSSRSSSISGATTDRRHRHLSGAPVSPMSPPPTGGLFQDRVNPDANAQQQQQQQQPVGNNHSNCNDDTAAAPQSNSTHNDHHNPLQSHPSSGTNTPQRQSKNLQLARGWPGHPYPQQPPSEKTAANGNSLRPFYGDQRAAASETGLGTVVAADALLPFGTHSARYSMVQAYNNGNNNSSSNSNSNSSTGRSSPHKPYHQYQYNGHAPPQIPPLDELLRDRRARGGDDEDEFAAAAAAVPAFSVPVMVSGYANGVVGGVGAGVPVAELRGSETHISELQ